VRALIKQFIAAEESEAKPLSDSQLSDMLKEQGIDCARRTVAKYREALRIAPRQPALPAPSLTARAHLFMNQLSSSCSCPAPPASRTSWPTRCMRLTGCMGEDLLVRSAAACWCEGAWRDAMLLNLHSRLAQRVLVQLFAHAPTATSRTSTAPPARWPGRSGSRRARASRSRSPPSTARSTA
jgi:hypothetical protein